ncbi:MAG: hypothetical protein U1F48_20055 [Burkholderiales bacterium]
MTHPIRAHIREAVFIVGALAVVGFISAGANAAGKEPVVVAESAPGVVNAYLPLMKPMALTGIAEFRGLLGTKAGRPRPNPA